MGGLGLWVKCGPTGTVVLLACRANKGEPHAVRPRGLHAGVGTLALANGSLTSLMRHTEAQYVGGLQRNDSLYRILMSFSGSFDMASTVLISFLIIFSFSLSFRFSIIDFSISFCQCY